MNKPLITGVLLSGVAGLLIGWALGRSHTTALPAPAAATASGFEMPVPPPAPAAPSPVAIPAGESLGEVPSSAVLPAADMEDHVEIAPPSGPLPALPHIPPLLSPGDPTAPVQPDSEAPANAKALRRAVMQIAGVSGAEWEAGSTLRVRARGDANMLLEQSCLVMRSAGQPVKIHLTASGETKLRQCW